ncbi:hypothetical protein SAMN05216338_1001859 [Bradyrhizobium sp. Rc2d]|uniref:hypothetical protein n=1 Tax=Bradyrhizobium sp. Rc2d TaxID=1855321 RepID=UPI0008899A1D|nr:hypothetical protein [Bradyrhizobium sp. Rc2d]SDG59840.1 hypothetical protein SAMN05216338_1001859 [Bradyrhizobium sp. Rc2d]
MSDFIVELMSLSLSSIPAKHWQSFLKIFADGAQTVAIERGLVSIKRAVVEAGADEAKQSRSTP